MTSPDIPSGVDSAPHLPEMEGAPRTTISVGRQSALGKLEVGGSWDAFSLESYQQSLNVHAVGAELVAEQLGQKLLALGLFRCPH